MIDDTGFPRRDTHVFVDLFAGLGGASQAALDAGWHVLRFDNNTDLADGLTPDGEPVRNMHFKSVTDHDFMTSLDIRLEGYAKSICVAREDLQVFLWGSPPCTEFSDGYNAPKIVARREGRDFTPDTSLVLRFLLIRDHIHPKWWCLENVKGSIPFIAPLVIDAAVNRGWEKLQEKPQVIGPFVLWHNFAPIQVPFGWKPEKKTDIWPGPFRANIRAYVPMAISQGVLNAIYQPRLEDF